MFSAPQRLGFQVGGGLQFGVLCGILPPISEDVKAYFAKLPGLWPLFGRNMPQSLNLIFFVPQPARALGT
jgi:hypothetical protein